MLELLNKRRSCGYFFKKLFRFDRVELKQHFIEIHYI